MSTRTESPAPRIPLSRERVLAAAIDVADRGGIAALTMRKVAEELDVEAMSLYYHVANKEELLDGVVDALVGEINSLVDEIEPSGDWRATIRERILTARLVWLQHPWAPQVIESRVTMGFSVVKYYEGLLGLMRGGGFSYDLAHHAMHALGSRGLGFTQELFNPDDSSDDTSAATLAEMASQVPHLVEMLTEISHDDPGSTLGWCDDQTEFEFGLDLLLDGLERARRAD